VFSARRTRKHANLTTINMQLHTHYRTLLQLRSVLLRLTCVAATSLRSRCTCKWPKSHDQYAPSHTFIIAAIGVIASDVRRRNLSALALHVQMAIDSHAVVFKDAFLAW
jgi:hypothetical protein